MAFQITPLQIPNMRTDYSAENSAFSNLGQTLGSLPADIRKQAESEAKKAAYAEAAKNGDYTTLGRALILGGDVQSGAALLGLGQKQNEQAQRTKILGQWGVDGGVAAAPSAAATPTAPGADFVTYRNQGAIRNQPIRPDLVSAMSFLPGMGVTMQVTSGGQEGIGEGTRRTGSTRHDHGGAGDVQFMHGGRALSWENPQDVPMLQQIVRQARANGVTGLGAGPGYMSPTSTHIGFGREAIWGARGGQPYPALAEALTGTGRAGVQVAAPVMPVERGGALAPPGQPAPVQIAQAPPQLGEAVSDVPAQGAAETQFVIPGTNTPVASVPSIANDPKVRTWQQRYTQAAAVGDEKLMNVAKAQLDFATKEAERRYNEGKAPESVREWQWARQNGMTTAKSPTEYAKELAAAKRDPDSDVTNLRKEVQQLPSYKNISQAAPIYRSMFETAGRNTKASDLNLVYGLGKIMDPTSVVREGEMIMVKNSAGMSEQLMGAINALNGGAALTPETRQALMAEAYSRMNTYKGQFDQDMKQYRGIVQRRGFNADDVIPDPGEFSPYEGPPKAPGAGQTAPISPAPVRQVESQYVRPDGSSPPTPSAPATPSAPRRGELVDGYRFKGGDAGKPENWVKVK